MSRVAEPKNESYLLNIALCGTASHVEQTVRGYRRALDAAELTREAIQQRDQSLWLFTEADGSLVIRGRVPAEVGALFKRTLEAAEDALRTPKNVPAGTSLDEDDLHRSRKRRVEALVVHVDAETFRHGHPGRCELEHGPSIAAETARRLACDCSVMRIIETETGEPLDVGRKTRTIPPGIRRALNARDKGCRFPGCTFKRYVDGHHLKHWAQGGETKLSNLVTLCRFHHRLVHEGGVDIRVLDDGAFRFVKPDGRSFESPAPTPTAWTGLVATPAERQVGINPQTAVTKWTGEVLDLGAAMDWLMRKSARGPSRKYSALIVPPPGPPAPSRPT